MAGARRIRRSTTSPQQKKPGAVCSRSTARRSPEGTRRRPAPGRGGEEADDLRLQLRVPLPSRSLCVEQPAIGGAVHHVAVAVIARAMARAIPGLLATQGSNRSRAADRTPRQLLLSQHGQQEVDNDGSEDSEAEQLCERVRTN